jgi:hypothetical protein
MSSFANLSVISDLQPLYLSISQFLSVWNKISVSLFSKGVFESALEPLEFNKMLKVLFTVFLRKEENPVVFNFAGVGVQ